jgi:hypothetical protein
LQNSPIFPNKDIRFDAKFYATRFKRLNLVKFIVKFKEIEQFTFLIFFTGAVHVNFGWYMCFACSNEIRFYSGSKFISFGLIKKSSEHESQKFSKKN